MKFLYLALANLFLMGYLTAYEDVIETYADKKIAWTIPKCGTNLLVVLLDRIFDNQLEGIAPGQGPKKAHLQKFYLGHFQSFHDFLNSDVYFKKVSSQERFLLLVRDLRDCILSSIDYMDHNDILLWSPILFSLQEDLEELHMHLYGFTGNFSFSNSRNFTHTQKMVLRLLWNQLTREEKINRTITAFTHFIDHDLSIFETLQAAIENELLYLVRFEKILPVEGGNSPDELINEICRIAHFLGVDIPANRYESIISGLWGNRKSWTFTNNPTKKGRWLTEFSESNIQYFESELGALNRALGYN